MRNTQNERFRRILHADPLLEHASREVRQIVEKGSIPPEDSPKFTGHREDNARIRNVGKSRFLFFQPLERSSITAAWAESRFAAVVATPFFGIGGILLPSKRSRAAVDNCSEVLADCWASPRPIPRVWCCFENLLKEVCFLPSASSFDLSGSMPPAVKYAARPGASIS